ncbi:TVP38/TMEM64 family protein [Methanocella conradii]|uniref:TVP38/TMEM64 family protein n=1 Tax=Methanocella conradii TaxID=1175444 RepID=UPI0024B33028|nr:TVP38/TMEM64 family protein [Methanocella conradii]MDI6896209.1 TVP38/TMEM64 family protein [Methanocella conradii]
MALRTMLNLRLAFLTAWAIAIVAVILYVGPENILREYGHVTPSGIRDVVLSYGPLSAIAYIALHAMRPFTFLPVTPFTIAGGFIFGHAYGLLLAMLGTTSAAVITFAMSRYLFRDYVKKRLAGKYAGLDDRLNGQGILIVAAMRMVPVIPYDAVGYLAGVSSIGFVEYLLGTLLGELPGAFVLTMLGSSLDNIRSPLFMVSLILAALLILLPEIYRRVSGKPQQ